jgi:hypothetical protein
MAYGLRYQSDFYNTPPFETFVSVKIYKKDYTDSVVDDVRTSQVEIQSNYQDDNTPIIGSGAKVVIKANSDDMTFLEDLLLSYERQFMCTIEYGGQIVFRGYSICDLNERQLLPYAEITMQFTDYLHRLEEHFPVSLKKVTEKANVFSLVNEILTLTNLDLPLFVNSTLFETTMSNGSTDSFLNQILVQNAQFFTDAFTYDNIYDAINKCLQPFSAFLYYYNEQWIIERQEDITRTGNWVKYTGLTPSSVASLKQEYNKQNGDWEYVDCSQVIEYNSGLHTLILELRDKKYDSLIFNDYTADMETTVGLFPVGYEHFPTAGQLNYRKWYANEDLSELEVGVGYQDMNTWIKYTSAPSGSIYEKGLYYNFAIQFNKEMFGDSSGGVLGRPSILNIDYKMSTQDAMTDIERVQLRFLLRLDGGPFSDWWVDLGQSNQHGQMIYLYPPVGWPGDVDQNSTDPAMWLTYNNIIDVKDNHQLDWSIMKSINTTSMMCYVWGGLNDAYNSLWEALGFPEFQRFTIIFLPAWYSLNSSVNNPYWHDFVTNYLGDVTVALTVEDINNKIEYHLNENFVRTDTVELYLFDLPNINYSNGLMLPTEDSETDEIGLYTRLWTSENSTTPAPLYEVFAKCKFRKYGRTIHRLKGKILTDNVLKIFSVLTDDTIPSETSGGTNMLFLLNGFTWDLINATYDIEAEEYTEEEILVGGVGGEPTYDEDGDPIQEQTAPSTPSGLTAYQNTNGVAVMVEWNPVAGAQGYKLQRRPTFWNGIWADFNTEIFRGTNNWCVDFVGEEGDPTGVTFIYRVCAYNSAGDSAWSSDLYYDWV